jgi:hypothetical protein
VQPIKCGNLLEKNVPAHAQTFMFPALLKILKQVVDVKVIWLGMKPKRSAFTHGNVHVTTKEGVTQKDQNSNTIVTNGLARVPNGAVQLMSVTVNALYMVPLITHRLMARDFDFRREM